MSKLFFLFVFALILPVLCQAKDKSSLPIKYSVNGLNIVEIELGNKTYEFLIDSGSNANFIDPSIEKELAQAGVIKRKKSLDTMVNTFKSKVKAKGYEMSFSLGGKSFKNIPTYSMNNKRFHEDKDGFDCCHGILGIDVLMQGPVKFDLDLRRVTFLDKVKGSKYFLPLEIVGKNVIKLQCQKDQDILKFRLDSGSEVPLVLHNQYVTEKLVLERAYKQGYRDGSPFVDMNQIYCGNIRIDLTAFAYKFNTGALSHKFVDGNLGAQVLGKNYIFDLKNKKIHLGGDYVKAKLNESFKSYNIEKEIISKDMRGNLDQAELLIINSCAATDGVENCLNKWCSLRGIKNCSNKGGSNLERILKTYYQKRNKDCSLRALNKALTERPLEYDYCWWRANIENNIESKMNLKLDFKDQDTQLYLVKSHQDFTEKFYCYAINEKIITRDSVPPLFFALSVKGMSLSKKGTDSYRKWLLTKDGKNCLSEIDKLFEGRASTSLVSEFKGKKYMIALNPITILGDGSEKFKKNLDKTLNHERLHILYAKSESNKLVVRGMWNNLSEEDKLDFKAKYKSYNLSNEDVLLKEFFSYTFEKDYDEALKLLSK